MTYQSKRYLGFIIIFFVAIVMPFVTIDGNHLMLLYFAKQEFHFLGMVFSVQELQIMPFLVMFLFVGMFAMTALVGRFWCGWACPQTMLRFVFRDVIQTYILKLRKSTDNKQKEPDMSLVKNKIKYVLSVIIFTSLAFVVSANFMLYFAPPEYFFKNILDYENHKTLIFFTLLIAFIVIMLVVVFKENFCIYACPYARVQSILYDKDTLTAVYSNVRGGLIYDNREKVIHSKKDFTANEECVLCDKCVRVCPTHIDIRKGLQIECIECLSCVDACTSVMGKFNKPSLIQWVSEDMANNNKPTKIIRTKSIAYGVVLSIILAMLYVNTFNKEYLKLNVNRTSQLYSIKDNSIQNAYIILFHNKTSVSHKYYLKTNNADIKIARPTKPFVIKGGKKEKIIVALEMSKNKIQELKASKKSNIVEIDITAYALDDSEITTTRDSFFTFPK